MIPGLKHDPDDLRRMFGGDKAERLIEVAGGAADEVFALIRRYDIDCEATRKGWIQPAASPAALRAIEKRAEQWRQRGVPVEMLDKSSVAQRIGSNDYLAPGSIRAPAACSR